MKSNFCVIHRRIHTTAGNQNVFALTELILRDVNQGKTAHTDPQFKLTMDTFIGNQIMIPKDNDYNDNDKYRLNEEG